MTVQIEMAVSHPAIVLRSGVSEPSTFGRRHWLIAIAVCLVTTFVFGYYDHRPRTPIYDEIFYLQHALSVHDYGVHSAYYQPDGDPPQPGAHAGPLYPLFLSMLFSFDPDLYERSKCLVARVDECGPGIGLAYPVQLGLAGISVFLIYAAGVMLLQSRAVGLVASALYLFASDIPVYFANHLLTETFVLPLSFAALLAFVLSIRRESLVWMSIAGLLLALTALVRPSYFYFGIACLLFALAYGVFQSALRRRRFAVIAALVFGISFIVPTGAWLVRNIVQMDLASFNAGASDIVLQQRVAYNDMTRTEWLASWLFYLPDFGDRLAAKTFGAENVYKLNISHLDGYVQSGSPSLAAELATLPAGTDRSAWLVSEKIIGDLPVHLAVSLALSWQGVFVGQYVGLLGVLALIWCAVAAIRQRALPNIVLLALPGIFLLGMHANISVNVPRYNLSLLLPMCLAIAAIIVSVPGRRRRGSQ